MSIPDASQTDLVGALTALRDVLARVDLPLELPSASHAADLVADLLNQLDDYVLPRIANLEAPLIAVVGGPTGSGKSTLVNSILGEDVAKASAIRPTTRRPLLVHFPSDRQWFESSRVFPGLARVSGDVDGRSHTEIALVESQALPEGLALLDSPDIDSVVEENRRLASQLMSAADVWLFVTSAARYADAIPWVMLAEAAARNVVVAVVLDRVPAGVGAQVWSDLARRLRERGLGHAPLFVISERLDDDDRIPTADVEPILGWLKGLVHDAGARASVARQTLLGAVGRMVVDGRTVGQALDEQIEVARAMSAAISEADGVACGSIVASFADGRILRAEVLERWNEVVGTGTWMRRLEGGVARVRDRLAGWFRGERGPVSVEKVGEGIKGSLTAALVAEAEGAIKAVDEAWRTRPGAGGPRKMASSRIRSEEERAAAAEKTVRDWERSLASLVGDRGKDKRATARLVSVGVNMVGAALMIVVFASTAGLSGGEVAVAGGTAVLAERLLEAIFGDEAVRSMARKAREDLLERASAFVSDELAPFRAACDAVTVGSDFRDEVVGAFDRLGSLRTGEERR